MAFLTLILIFIVVVFLLLQRAKKKGGPLWLGMPGPSYILPFFGNFFEIRYSLVSTYLSKWAIKYGGIYRMYSFGRMRVMVSEPALVKQVLLNNYIYDKDVITYRVLAVAVGKGLVSQIDEKMHRYHRSIVTPAFASKYLRNLVPIFQRKAKILVEDWQKLANTNTLVPVRDHVGKAISDAVGEAAFGYKLNSQRNESPLSIHRIMTAVIGSGINLWEAVPGIKYLTPGYHERIAAVKMLAQQVDKMIDERQEKRSQLPQKIITEEEEGKEGDGGEVEERDLLDLMMDCQNEDGAMLTKLELANQIRTFLLAGYETSSTGMLWLIYALARHPEIQQKVADEVIGAIGRDKEPTAEDIDKMPYLYKVLKESLRFYPPVPLVQRNVSEDTSLGGYLLPKGTSVFINIYHQHRYSPVWTNPNKFDPERWSNDESELANLSGSYIPFLIGARNCIGSKFALLELRVILAMILQKFWWVPESGPEILAYSRLALVPVKPIHIKLYHRE